MQIDLKTTIAAAGVFIALMGAAYGYGVLNTEVSTNKGMRDEIKEMSAEVNDMALQLATLDARITVVEEKVTDIQEDIDHIREQLDWLIQAARNQTQ